MVSKGEIWLANLNPQKKSNEVGKMRPVLIVQSNYLNSNDYPTTIIIPLSTKLIDETQPLRYRIKKRDNLHQNSDALIAHIRAIDNNRFIEKLACLTTKEISSVKNLIVEVID